MNTKFSKAGHRPDYLLLALVFLLTAAGLVILSSASSDLGQIKFNDSYYYLKRQMLYGLSVGLVGFLIALKLHYQYYRKIAFAFLLLNLGLLGLVFTSMGVTSGGATRWLALGPVTFQPAELLKLSFIIYLAAWLTNPKMNRTERFWAGVVPFAVICGLVGVFLLLQPATSMVVILLSAGGAMYLVSGAKLRHLLAVGLIGALLLGLIVWTSPYRRARVMSFLDPHADTEGSSYQINQALMTIGSGQLQGIGYGRSTTKVNLLPAPLGDSIFAIAAQELGFIGASSIVFLFAFLVLRLLWIGKNLRDRFGELIMVGFASVVAFQSLVNMGAISGLIPLTGVPLPFISYGGTALAVFLTMSGVAMNVSKYT